MTDLARVSAPLAVRAYVPPGDERRQRVRRDEPELVLVLDFETRTDPSQRLTFGSYRVYRSTGKLVQEGIVYADDLPPTDRQLLERYVRDHADDRGGRLRLMSRTDFVRAVLWPIGYEARALIVGYNLPFDLSRIAVGWRPAREGGVSLKLWQSVSADGEVRDHRWRPEIRVRALDPKRQFIEFTGPMKVDSDNRVVIDAAAGLWAYYRGRFLDLHTLAFALTDRNLTLNAAAGAFGLAERKEEVERHGEVTEPYVDYNRQDVRLTWQLYLALRAEWERHPIDLDPEQAMSPAGVAKGYLRAGGITPPLGRAADIDPLVLGRFMVGYLGGRSEERIRRAPLPCVYTDFSSMYVSIWSLLGLDRWLAAASFQSYDATDMARRILAMADRDRLFEPRFWQGLAGIVCRIRPGGEIRHIGKESNRLDETEDGIIRDADEVYVEYRDEKREWEAAVPKLRGVRGLRGTKHLMDISGLSERAVRDALNRNRMPHPQARQALLRVARESG